MLVFTNRILNSKAADERALTRAYTPFSEVLHSVRVSGKPQAWKVDDARVGLTDAAALKQLGEVLSGSKPVLLFLHGNNNTPNDCFTRCQQLEQQYPVSVIGFTWTSEGCLPDGTELPGQKEPTNKFTDPDEGLAAATSRGSLQGGWVERKARRYGQAKLNAQHSKDALARWLRLAAAARLGGMQQKVSLAAHSLGCHFMHYAIDEQDAEASLAAMHNVALIAGCTGVAKHSAWVGQIHPLLRVYITYIKADSVLYAARLIDGDVKLGTDPGNERLVGEKYRYVDFESAKVKVGAHRYFVADEGTKLTKPSQLLFSRVFSSESDYSGGIEQRKKVYPGGCSPDGAICYMGAGPVKKERR